MNPLASRRKKYLKENLEAFAYLAPAGIILLVFWFLPVVLSVYVSLTNWKGADTLDLVRFVGLRNYLWAFRAEYFIKSLLI